VAAPSADRLEDELVSLVMAGAARTVNRSRRDTDMEMTTSSRRRPDTSTVFTARWTVFTVQVDRVHGHVDRVHGQVDRVHGQDLVAYPQQSVQLGDAARRQPRDEHAVRPIATVTYARRQPYT